MDSRRPFFIGLIGSGILNILLVYIPNWDLGCEDARTVVLNRSLLAGNSIIYVNLVEVDGLSAI
jgi:hypothetical protein